MIELCKLQKEIMNEFYSLNPCRVIYTKSERKKIWDKVKNDLGVDNIDEIKNRCPALAHQIEKSIYNSSNIQSAVFSECVYAQTLANIFRLNNFINCYISSKVIPDRIIALLHSYGLNARYAYSNDDGSRMLIQAGSCYGIDSALITIVDLNIYTIEFKEPGAKTSEPDLPKYGEDGMMVVTEEFIDKYPQFGAMLEEQKNMCFFDQMGSNVRTFSEESINIAVSNNYVKKYADVVCTEDKKGYLTMLPSNQLSIWAKIEGEIRPAGRNNSKVWTPLALRKFLLDKGATIVGTKVSVNANTLSLRKERGGTKYSGYKINPLFFVYKEDYKMIDNILYFDLSSVRQLKPTIAGKVFFKTLQYTQVKKYYFGD